MDVWDYVHSIGCQCSNGNPLAQGNLQWAINNAGYRVSATRANNYACTVQPPTGAGNPTTINGNSGSTTNTPHVAAYGFATQVLVQWMLVVQSP
jgi:hypothetical protein